MACLWRVLFAAPLFTLVLFFCPHKVKGGEITEIHLEVAPRQAPRVSAVTPPTTNASQASPRSGFPGRSVIPITGGGSRATPGVGASAVAFRWGWGVPQGRGIFPVLVDLHELADTKIEEAVVEKTREEGPRFEMCVSQALERGEPIPHRGVIRVVLEDDGEARVVSLRMEGPHSTALKDCFWKVIRPWRIHDLPPIEHTKVLYLAIDKGRMGEEATPPEPTPTPIDRSQGLIGLVGLEPPHSRDTTLREDTLRAWVPELKGCFQSSWDHIDYTCDGPLTLPLELAPSGEVISVGVPAFWVAQSEDGEDGMGPNALDLESAAEIDGEPSEAGVFVDPLTPHCAPVVTPCLVNTLSLWRLPEAEEREGVVLRLMVHPPGRLEEAPPPALWLEPADPLGDEGLDE